jgi:hypothetical protein
VFGDALLPLAVVGGLGVALVVAGVVLLVPVAAGSGELRFVACRCAAGVLRGAACRGRSVLMRYVFDRARICCSEIGEERARELFRGAAALVGSGLEGDLVGGFSFWRSVVLVDGDRPLRLVRCRVVPVAAGGDAGSGA